MIIAGTGHRPSKLGGYHVQPQLIALATCALNKYKPTEVISGMALGWDQALAEAAIFTGIPFNAYVPCIGQERMWPATAQKTFNSLLLKAKKVVLCSDTTYNSSVMQKRNEMMVRDCTDILALWNGTSGGTANCIRYANQMKRPIINVWASWEKYK